MSSSRGGLLWVVALTMWIGCGSDTKSPDAGSSGGNAGTASGGNAGASSGGASGGGAAGVSGGGSAGLTWGCGQMTEGGGGCIPYCVCTPGETYGTPTCPSTYSPCYSAPCGGGKECCYCGGGGMPANGTPVDHCPP